MKKRTKIFLYVLVAAIVFAVLMESVKTGPAVLVKTFIVFGFGWLVWRIILFIRNLLRPTAEALEPIAAKVNPSLEKLNNHVDQSLRDAGLGKIADANKTFQKGIEGFLKKK